MEQELKEMRELVEQLRHELRDAHDQVEVYRTMWKDAQNEADRASELLKSIKSVINSLNM